MPEITGSIELTDEEKKTIETQRDLAEKIKQCSNEINTVLSKYGMTLQIMGTPQIIVVPAKTNG